MPFISKVWALFLLVSVSGCDRGSPGTESLVETPPEPTSSELPLPVASDPSPAVTAVSTASRELTWTYPGTKLGRLDVVVSIPMRSSEEERLPVLVALHGMGEAMKRSPAGARGWIDDYELLRIENRLRHPPLKSADFLGFVTDERLAVLNEGLVDRPYRGVIVVTPYAPRRISDDRSGRSLRQFTDFLVDELLPRVYREIPAALGTPESTGIDGVSFGGRTALLVGLRRAEAFGALGTLQAACVPGEAPGLAASARRALEANPRLRIRLLSSHGDGFLGSNRAISAAFRRVGVPHELLVVPGPHNYQFNRGPGSIEMLLFHDRALRGEQHR